MDTIISVIEIVIEYLFFALILATILGKLLKCSGGVVIDGVAEEI